MFPRIVLSTLETSGVSPKEKDCCVGDVVRGACCVTNAVKKRLFDDIAKRLVGVVG